MPNNAAETIYKEFRNTMVHGYRARTVYVTEDIGSWDIDRTNGFLSLNPYWFYKKFDQDVFEKFKVDLKKSQQGDPIYENFKLYMDELLN